MVSIGLIRCARLLCCALACFLVIPANSPAQTKQIAGTGSDPLSPPAWAYPVNPPDLPKPRVTDGPIHVAGSDRVFVAAQLADLFRAPDWHPADHPVMPEVVAQGRMRHVYACGYCHLPDGVGRPENADLAGLPVEYIERQLADFKSGARRSAVPSRVPPQLMIELAQSATNDEIEAAAEYFSRLQHRSHLQVVETGTVPHAYVAGWFLAADLDSKTEPIGRRIIEVPEDLTQFEHRDARSRFIAYVPMGSVKAGQFLVSSGGEQETIACAGCHGADLRGSGAVPRIAGRSPSYIVRQLFDIQSGFHTGANVAAMKEVVRRLTLDDMIAIGAYLATVE
jgi:cytochrome c553